MFGLGGNATTSTYGVLIDVGSGSVGVGIVKSDHQRKLPEIIFSHRVYMRVRGEPIKSDDHLRRMKEALFSACLILSKDGMQALSEFDRRAKIKRILVTCSSPWSHTVSRNVSYSNDEVFKITEALVADLARNAEEEMITSLNENAIAGSAGLKIVERATVNLQINDYTVSNPIGLKGTSVALSHITGLIPEDIIEAIREVQEKIFPETKISTHTYMLIMYCVMRDLFPKTDSLMIVDVTGESTEIGIVEEGILKEVVHCPYGSNTLIREISKKTNGSVEDTLSLLKAFSEQASSEKSQQKALGYMVEFNAELTKVIKGIAKTRTIPHTIIVTALPQLESLFRTKVPETVHGVTGDEYVMLEMQKGVLDELATMKNTDVFISVASRFFHKLHGCGEIDTL